MRMHLQRAERFRRPRGWLIPAALLAAFVPKCVLCLLAYAGIAGALGLGPEICGGPGGKESWVLWLAASSLVLFAAVVIARRQHRRAAARDGFV